MKQRHRTSYIMTKRHITSWYVPCTSEVWSKTDLAAYPQLIIQYWICGWSNAKYTFLTICELEYFLIWDNAQQPLDNLREMRAICCFQESSTITPKYLIHSFWDISCPPIFIWKLHFSFFLVTIMYSVLLECKESLFDFNQIISWISQFTLIGRDRKLSETVVKLVSSANMRTLSSLAEARSFNIN